MVLPISISVVSAVICTSNIGKSERKAICGKDYLESRLFSREPLSASACNKSAKKACSRLAAHPDENVIIDGESVGVKFDNTIKEDAISACRSAIQQYGDASINTDFPVHY